MHIALWSPGWPLKHYQNGIVTYVHWVRQHFEALGHRVSVFTPETTGLVDDPRVHLVRRDRLGRLLLRVVSRLFPTQRGVFAWEQVIAARMLEVHRFEPIDIVEMEESFGWSADVARLTQLPVLVKLHGPAFLTLVGEELSSPMGQQRVHREGAALALADAIAAPTAITLSQTFERYQLNPAIQTVIANPLGMETDAPIWQLEACNRDLLLFVGRFDRLKGADVLLRAFELLLRQRPGLKLVFVGPDLGLRQPDGSHVGFDAFRDATFAPEFRDRIDFRGRMANRDIAALRVRAMVTVVASRWETQGYTALEAMSQGCPVVCTDAGGCPEIITHGGTGLLARSEDPADFAAKLATMLDDPQAAAAMGAAARRQVVENHAAAKIARESLALYERVIEHRRVSRGSRP